MVLKHAGKALVVNNSLFKSYANTCVIIHLLFSKHCYVNKSTLRMLPKVKHFT